MVTLESVREHKGRLLIALEQAQDATAAARFIGATFFAPREALDVEPGEYLDVDLVGCTVLDTNGRPYGSVERVEHYPASDMLVVGGKLLPMVARLHFQHRHKEKGDRCARSPTAACSMESL